MSLKCLHPATKTCGQGGISGKSIPDIPFLD